MNPVVFECNDGKLNDIRGMHVTEEHAELPLTSRQLGRIARRAQNGIARTGSITATRSGVYNKEIRKDYDEHFASGCSKSLACMEVCPMKIPTLSSMAKLNRGR